LADRLSLPSDGSYPRIYQNFTPSSTATHTFSIWLKGETEGQGCFVGAFRNSPWSLPSSTIFNITTEWVNYSFNITPQDTSSMQLYIGSHNSHGGKSFLMYGALLQTGGTKTVFTDGTRSSTQSLIDLTKTSTINVSNVSFDSTGQPTFDGTDDYIELTEKVIPSTGPFTMEFLYQRSTSGGRGGMFERNTSSPYNGALIGQGGPDNWYFQVNNGTQSLTINDMGYPAADTWHHDVGVYDGVNTIKFFRNGVLHDSVTGSTLGNLDSAGSRQNLSIMKRDSNSTVIGGKVAVCKVYNRALSADEVQQNYNAYKNRFNL
jgi:hypothetical protein